jgi:hypothetical protein
MPTRLPERVRPPILVALVALLAAGSACGDDGAPRTPPAAAVSLGTTSTLLSPGDPPVVVGGAPGTDGHLPVRLNPLSWKTIASERREDDPRDPYYEVHSEGHDDFWFGVELHTVEGLGWTGEQGLFATDCATTGICVRFDPDGGEGPIVPMLAGPLGEVDVEEVGSRISLAFRNLVFTRDDGVTYRIDAVPLRTR